METIEKRQLKGFVKLKQLRVLVPSIDYRYPLLIIAIIMGLLILGSHKEELEQVPKQTDTLETFSEFVERVLMERSSRRETYFLAKMSEKMQKMLIDSVDMDFEGFKWIIGDNDIAHIEKNHGDYKKEFLRGQINVTIKDYSKIYSIINAPDNIELSINKKSGEKYLKLSKFISKQKHTFVVLISKKKWRLTGKTMYIKKASTIKPMPF